MQNKTNHYFRKEIITPQRLTAVQKKEDMVKLGGMIPGSIFLGSGVCRRQEQFHTSLKKEKVVEGE